MLQEKNKKYAANKKTKKEKDKEKNVTICNIEKNPIVT